MHRTHHGFVILGTGYGEHVRMGRANDIFALAETTGHDHLAVLGECFADRIQRFLNRGVDEAAGIHHDDIGSAVTADDLVAFHPQLREDAL